MGVGQTECLQQANVSRQATASAADLVEAIDAAEHHGDPRTAAVRMFVATEAALKCGEPLNDDFARIEPSEVRRLVRASFGRMRACYERALGRSQVRLSCRRRACRGEELVRQT
jgi:hypothetical protein